MEIQSRIILLPAFSSQSDSDFECGEMLKYFISLAVKGLECGKLEDINVRMKNPDFPTKSIIVAKDDVCSLYILIS